MAREGLLDRLGIRRRIVLSSTNRRRYNRLRAPRFRPVRVNSFNGKSVPTVHVSNKAVIKEEQVDDAPFFVTAVCLWRELDDRVQRDLDVW